MSAAPTNLKGMLRWFLRLWDAEQETVLHRRGVWVGEQAKTGDRWPATLTGGSQLGSPADGPAMRAIVSPQAFRVEHGQRDGETDRTATYATPMAATLAWMATRHPLKADWLRAIGRSGGDWQQVTVAASLPDEYGEAITRDALGFCYRHFEEAPLTRAA